MGPIEWAILCLGAAVLLFVIDLFVPTGGVGMVLSGVCMVGFVVFMFTAGPATGVAGLMIAIVALGAAPFIVLKVLPETPVIKWLTLKNTMRSESQEQGNAGVDQSSAASGELVGKTGKALSDLRPVGTCMIAGKRRDCLAVAGVIPAGRTVVVIAADGMQIKVREAD